MKKSLTLKKTKKLEKVNRHAADVVEMNIQEITWVAWAMFDLKTTKVDVEIEEWYEVEFNDLARAITKDGRFTVLSAW